MKAEVFYLLIQGAQRGPYTVQQIDHQLNSGLIDVETLFWREGLEQWLPVTDLVSLRKPVRRWIMPAVVGGFLLALLLAARLLGPTVRIGWREANQHDFTVQAAYWRARDYVRREAVPSGSLVEFAPASASQVELQPTTGADVSLKGTLTDSHGATRAMKWLVSLGYDQRLKEWAGISVKEEN